jgi:hypothetical protein
MSIAAAVYALGNVRKALFVAKDHLIIRPSFGRARRIALSDVAVVREATTVEFETMIEGLEVVLRGGEVFLLSDVRHPKSALAAIKERLEARPLDRAEAPRDSAK